MRLRDHQYSFETTQKADRSVRTFGFFQFPIVVTSHSGDVKITIDTEDRDFETFPENNSIIGHEYLAPLVPIPKVRRLFSMERVKSCYIKKMPCFPTISYSSLVSRSCSFPFSISSFPFVLAFPNLDFEVEHNFLRGWARNSFGK